MNIYSKRLMPIFALALLSSLLFGCADETVLQDPGNAAPNPGTVSQRHFFIGFDPLQPAVFDLATGSRDLSVEMTIVAHVGDRNNQILTDPHTVYFETEWGLIEPSCTTEKGECSVTWFVTGDTRPADYETTIVAYTVGEESFDDTNGNGTFDDGEIFYDVEEPWINVDGGFENPWVFSSGADIPVDTVNALDPTGVDGTHNVSDGLFNGGGCTHSTLCSPFGSIMVWDTASINLTGGQYLVGGAVSGLAGGESVVIQNNAGDDLTITANGGFFFVTPLDSGTTYDVTVLTNPATQTCSVTNGTGTVFDFVTNISVDCI